MITHADIMEKLPTLSTAQLQFISISITQLIESREKRRLWDNVIQAIKIYLTESGDSSIEISDKNMSSDNDKGFCKDITLDNFESVFLEDGICGLIEL